MIDFHDKAKSISQNNRAIKLAAHKDGKDEEKIFLFWWISKK